MIFSKKISLFLFVVNIGCAFTQNSNFKNSNKIELSNFSQTYSKFYNQENILDQNNKTTLKNYRIWEKESVKPFTELILSWNAFRPKKGQYSFWVSIRHNYWSKWYKIAEWGTNKQQTFVNTKNPFVHLKHVRMEMQKQRKGNAFKVRVVAEQGADIKNLKGLFVNTSDLDKFRAEKPNNFDLPATCIKGVRPQSQMALNHPRFRDFCSPTSLSIMMNYYSGDSIDLKDYVPEFAQQVLDQCYLDIYGNWILNVAQAYDSLKGKRPFRVERLNNFEQLYSYLTKKVPVAVSVRGSLRGGAKSYDNGHFILVVGWSKKKQRVLCIDPAFCGNSNTKRAYRISDFLQAWGTSRNLSYVSSGV